MKPEFWHDKWKNKEIGFHQAEPNRLLVKHFSRLGLPQGSRVFLPLCGKTIDFCWLLENGCRVVGAELSETAVKEFFDELSLEASISEFEKFKQYSAEGIDILVGDIFDLSPQELGPIEAVYDRAALVALPEETRSRYTTHLTELSSGGPQLVITFEYDQAEMAGPPFSISREELEEHYRDHYSLEELESSRVEGKLKGQVEAVERLTMLRAKV